MHWIAGQCMGKLAPMTSSSAFKAPLWTRILLAFFALFALAIGVLEITNPGQFGIDVSDAKEYLAMETGVARNVALGLGFAVIAWRGRAAEVAVALGLRALVDLFDLILVARAPEFSAPSAIMAAAFCIVAALGAGVASKADTQALAAAR